MLSEREHNALLDILDNIGHAEAFLADATKDELATDTLRFYAVTRALEIISEASRRLPATLKDRHPDAPWQRIAAAGNIYRHGYDIVSVAVVWQTVKDSLPALRAIIEVEIRCQSK
ncbi:DUF86 domain-containing protein [Mesorhizobium sp. LHD-90]|uniref:HepT-like ribonuclease domain-containing protein n=1 Tax=Mesorhizobium sp. LHD-90 TaxID=3071414 RepID=UPI0027DFF28D|nr:HepT-like ribonuclease domain-containing protein [Mesorhizobium sp. LHD-90]MDQ6433520.1 DUF86 domain-containing protein [Mesorhizobium sp. LHD-90]